MTIMKPGPTNCSSNLRTKSINELMIKTGHSKLEGSKSVKEFHSPIISTPNNCDHPLSEENEKVKQQTTVERQGSLVSESDIQYMMDIIKNDKKRKRKQHTNKGPVKVTNNSVDAVENQNVASCTSLSIDDDPMLPSSTSHSSYIPRFFSSSIKEHKIEEISRTLRFDDEIERIEDEIIGGNHVLNSSSGAMGTWGVKLDQCSSVTKCENKKSTSVVPRKRMRHCPPGECEVMVGSIQNLASSVKLNKHDKQLDILFGFIRRHQYGDETIQGVNTVDGAVQFVLLNFPSGMHVNGIQDNKVPFWNVVSPNLFVDALSIANKIVCDSGWVACIHTFEQLKKVEEEALASDFKLWRSFTLVCDKPIYCQVVQPKAKIHTLAISMFHRHRLPRPKPYYIQAGQLDHHQCSLSRDLFFEKIDTQEWLCKADGTPWRGGAQRSENIWRFLLLAFTRYADSVVDLMTGTGGFVKVASELGRHSLGIEADEVIVHQLLKSYAQSNRCHSNFY